MARIQGLRRALVRAEDVVMLGPPKPRWLDQPIAVSFADLVFWGIFSQHLEVKRALGFIHDWTWELSADRGRSSIDPVGVLLQLVMFAEGIHASRPTPDC